MRLGYHSITWGGVVGDATGVTSVKDLYYRASGSMETAGHDIGAAGYSGTEMFDGNLVDYAERPDELRQILADANVELVSVYTGANFIYADILPDELHRIERAAQLLGAVGVVGHVPVEHLDPGVAGRGDVADRVGHRSVGPVEEVLHARDAGGLADDAAPGDRAVPDVHRCSFMLMTCSSRACATTAPPVAVVRRPAG